MDLIWAKREGIYFCGNDWTGSISLIGFDKFAVWRKALEVRISLRCLGKKSGVSVLKINGPGRPAHFFRRDT